MVLMLWVRLEEFLHCCPAAMAIAWAVMTPASSSAAVVIVEDEEAKLGSERASRARIPINLLYSIM